MCTAGLVVAAPSVAAVRAQSVAPPTPAVEVTGHASAGGVRPDAGLDVGSEGLADMVGGAISRLGLQSKQRGLVRLAAHDYPAALELLTQAWSVAPDDPDLSRELGRLHMLLGRRAPAEAHLRRALQLRPGDAGAGTALADLLAESPTDEARLSEAASLLEAIRLGPGARPGASQRVQVILRQARVAAARGRFEEAQRFYNAYRAEAPLDDGLRLELGDFHRDRGRPEEALAHYRKVGRADPERARLAAQRMFELQADREALAMDLAGHPPAAEERLRARLQQARMLLAGGDADGAEAILLRMRSEAPLQASARALLAELAALRGDRQGAERHYLGAIVLGAGDAEHYAALGRLYARWQPRPRHAEAAAMFQRALRARPDLGTLHAPLAESLRALGDLPGALRHARLAIEGAADEPTRTRAVLLATELQRAVGAADEAGVDGAAVVGVAGAALARARTHMGRGDTAAALAALHSIPVAERSAAVLNQEAHILLATGQHARAREVLWRSLARSPAQAAIHATLGRSLLRDGDLVGARSHLARAEALGDLGAAVALRAVRASEARLWADLRRIGELRALALELRSPPLDTAGGAAAEARTRLLSKLDARIARGVALWSTAALCLLAALGLWLWRRNGGAGLPALVRAYPETGPQLQRILLSLRHEVLKHNTTMLAGLIAGIERGQPDRALAAHLEQAIFGRPKPPGTSAVPDAAGAGADADAGIGQGAAQRMAAYVAQLQQIGRAHRVRLNLRRRDPALTPILAGFEALARLRPRLHALAVGRGGDGRRLLAPLKRAHAAVNERGYMQLQAFVEALQVFRADRPALQAIFDGVLREPSIAGLGIAPLALSHGPGALPCALLIARHDFDDILTNLFRNAIQASSRAAGSQGQQPRVGLHVELELDEITGLRRARLHVRDTSPEMLSDETLRNQVIERGLGLTADRVGRYDGSLDVEAFATAATAEQQREGEGGPQWTKAVVLSLPLAPETERSEST